MVKSRLVRWAWNVARMRRWVLKRLWWENKESDVRFEVITEVTMKNAVFWDVTPCHSCKNRRFGAP
jgi:hypothetical protein